MRSGIAPTEATTESWSSRKLELIAAAAVSPASTSRGVRLLAASVRPVMVLVNPGPWWTLQTPSRPLTRAYASAIATAPPSCRDAMNAAPAATRELVTTKLPLPTRPKTSRTPRPASTAPTASATVGSGGPPDEFGRGLGSRQAAPLGVPVPLQVVDQSRAVQAPGLLDRIRGEVAAKHIKWLVRGAQRAPVGDQAGGARGRQLTSQLQDLSLDPVGTHHTIGQEPSGGRLGLELQVHEDRLLGQGRGHGSGEAYVGAAGDDALLPRRQVEEGAALGHHRIHDEEPLAGSADGPGVDGRQEGLLGPALLETVIPHPLW